MKILYRCCTLLMCLFAIINTAKSQTNTALSTHGHDFWLAVPLNDNKAQPTLQLEFYVTSSYNTLVTLEVPGMGFSRSKKLQANNVVIFTTKDASASFDFEVVSSQIAEPRGIHIYADQPISVCMMNAKQVTSDGYLALPISAWGTEYIHCSYYDYSEFRAWGAGFIVIASEDNTEVTITLRGKGTSVAKTRSGSKIGEVLGPIKLKKGEVYNVVGDATTRGQFDLTGSGITANKPIGVVSYHERTMLPDNNTNGRDHMVEMVPPVSTWGKKYASIELQRDNKGDFYRVVSSQPNTVVKMKYYDKTTKALLGQRDFILSKAGDYYEDYNSWVGSGAVTGFNGMTVWEANKPILVMQYAYSANWDKGTDFDPFMIVLTPQEQYLKEMGFQTPVNENFPNNYFSYIVEGDTTDPQQTKLKSLIIDGDTVWKSYPQLLLNTIPGTNLYWGWKTVTPGAHTVKSNTLLGGYVYGFGSFNSYGWSAALGSKSLAAIDTLPPVITSVNDCGDYTFHASELRDFGPPPPDSIQRDQGIFDIYTIDSVSYNYDLKLLTAEKIIPLPKITAFDFKLLVKDKTKDAFAVVIVIDRAGNYVADTVRYKGLKLPNITPSSHLFRVMSADTTLTQTISITNSTQNTISIESLSLKTATAFSIINGGISQKIDIAPAASHQVSISYKPINAMNNDTTTERDSLLIKYSGCSTPQQAVILEGKFIKLSVNSNPNALVFKTVVVDSAHTKTIVISNQTADTIYLRSTFLQNSSFFSIRNGSITSDWVFEPKSYHQIQIQYKPTSESMNKIDTDTLHISGLYISELRIPLEGALTPVGVDEEDATQSDFGMTITPNPADERIEVKLLGNHPQKVFLRLYDAIGREVIACSTESVINSSVYLPNIASLPAGAYRLVATSANGRDISSVLLFISH